MRHLGNLGAQMRSGRSWRRRPLVITLLMATPSGDCNDERRSVVPLAGIIEASLWFIATAMPISSDAEDDPAEAAMALSLLRFN